MITLYTLPTCPICEMIKTKLTAKGISYTEEDFSEVAEQLHTDRAPVMQITDEVDLCTNPLEVNLKVLFSPKEMVDWINSQE